MTKTEAAAEYDALEEATIAILQLMILRLHKGQLSKAEKMLASVEDDLGTIQTCIDFGQFGGGIEDIGDVVKRLVELDNLA